MGHRPSTRTLGTAGIVLGLALAGLSTQLQPQALGTASEPEAAADAFSHGQLETAVSVLADGSQLHLDLADPVELSVDTVQLEAELWLQPNIADPGAIVFAYDTSRSTNWLMADDELGCGGDYDGDGLTDTIMDCEAASIAATIQQLGALGTHDEVGIVGFFRTAQWDLATCATQITPRL